MCRKRLKINVNPFTPITIENPEIPSSKITRHCSRALARQQCLGRREKRLFSIIKSSSESEFHSLQSSKQWENGVNDLWNVHIPATALRASRSERVNTMVVKVTKINSWRGKAVHYSSVPLISVELNERVSLVNLTAEDMETIPII